jgi:hypothetical protein
MSGDDEAGMAWRNALTEQERAKWSAIAGDSWTRQGRMGSIQAKCSNEPEQRIAAERGAGRSVQRQLTWPACCLTERCYPGASSEMLPERRWLNLCGPRGAAKGVPHPFVRPGPSFRSLIAAKNASTFSCLLTFSVSFVRPRRRLSSAPTADFRCCRAQKLSRPAGTVP